MKRERDRLVLAVWAGTLIALATIAALVLGRGVPT